MKLLLALTLTLLCSLGALANQHPLPYQKPGAAIRLLDTAPIRLDADSDKTISIRFAAPDNGELTLQVNADAGLVVAEDKSTYIIDLAADGNPELTLNIKSLEPGRFHIKFHASINQGAATSGRVFGLAVQVGPEDTAASQQKTSPKYIIMQGEESIR